MKPVPVQRPLLPTPNRFPQRPQQQQPLLDFDYRIRPSLMQPVAEQPSVESIIRSVEIEHQKQEQEQELDSPPRPLFPAASEEEPGPNDNNSDNDDDGSPLRQIQYNEKRGDEPAPDFGTTHFERPFGMPFGPVSCFENFCPFLNYFMYFLFNLKIEK